jgi:TonB-dependent receptor
VIPPYTDPNNLYLGKFAGYRENTGNEQMNVGGLATLTYRLNKHNEVSVNLLFNQGANEGGTHLDGAYDNTGIPYSITNQVYQLTQSYRTFNTIQLRGEHRLSSSEYSPQVSWNVSTSHATELDPDNRFFSLITDSSVYGGTLLGGSGSSHADEDARYYQPLRARVSGIFSGYELNIDPNGRKYRHLTEDNKNYTLDLTLPFHLLGDRQLFKIGGFYLRKDRSFSEYVLYLPDIAFTGMAQNNFFPFHGNLNAWIAPGQIGFSNNYSNEGTVRSVGWLYYPQKTFNNYGGYQESEAGYAMLDLKIQKSWRLTGGVRFESTHIQGSLDTLGGSTDPQIYGYKRQGSISSSYNPGYRPYFSGSLIYNPRQDMNLRFAYSSTLARPELRELMSTVTFDPFRYAVVVGNPALMNQQTQNLDFRWEWFTRPGEVISVSAFYKWIDHQLTRTFSSDPGLLHTTGSKYNIIRYENDPEQGKVYGLEGELRKDLGRLVPELRNFFFGVNLMLARSIIKKNPERIAASRTIDVYSSAWSPVFEQPPYSLNTYLDYDNKKWGMDMTLNFNVVGPRLVEVRMTGEPDIYDHPVPVLDWVLSQRLSRKFILKAFVKNILDPAVSQYYATPGGSYTKFAGKTYINTSYHQGREIALGITYNAF